MSAQEIQVPDIGDFNDVPVIEIHVAPGDTVVGRGSADHPGVRQGHHGRARAGGRHGGRAAGRRRRPVSEGTVIMVIDAEGGRSRSAPPHPGSSSASPPPRNRRPPHRHRRPRPTYPAAICTPRCSCSAPGRAATPPRSAPPTSASRSCWSTPRPAGRRLPERRLHPVQGAAARGQGDRRDQGDGRPRAQLRRAHRRPRRAARLEGRRGQAADRRAGRAGQAAQGHGGRAPAGSPRRTRSRSPRRTGPPARSASTRRSSPPAPSR